MKFNMSLYKGIGSLVLMFLLALVFASPLRDYANNFFHKDQSGGGQVDAKKKDEILDEIMHYRLKSKDRVGQIQLALQMAGFYRGVIDGELGPQTTRAIIMFQESKGLKPDGIVGPETWEELSRYLK